MKFEKIWLKLQYKTAGARQNWSKVEKIRFHAIHNLKQEKLRIYLINFRTKRRVLM